MTTPNEELRKLAEDEIDARVHGQTQYEWGRVLPTKVIELLDRIDRLEAENEQRVFAYGVLEKVSSDLLAQNEAKDRLLEQALKDLVIFNEASRLHGMYWQRKHVDAITQHLKGKA